MISLLLNGVFEVEILIAQVLPLPAGDEPDPRAGRRRIGVLRRYHGSAFRCEQLTVTIHVFRSTLSRYFPPGKGCVRVTAIPGHFQTIPLRSGHFQPKTLAFQPASVPGPETLTVGHSC